MNKILTTGLTLFLTAALLGFSQQATAATRTVLNSADSGTGSLRQAIADASPGDVIQFASTVANIALSTALEIDKALTIDGGATGVTLSLAATGYRHIHITDGYTLTLQNMTLTGGAGGGGIEGIGAVAATDCVFTGNNGDSGGALHISGTVDLTNCQLTNNSATCQGGGIWANTAQLTNCTVSGNTAGSGGGIVAYAVVLNGCTVSGNSASSGSGGGIFAYSQSAMLVNCTVAGNTASSGGGIYAFNLPAASFTLTNCTVSGNFAPFGGGIWANANPAVLTGSVVAGNYAPAGGKASEMWINGSSNSVDPGSSYYIAGIPAGGLSSLMQTTTVNGCEVGLLAGNGGPTQTILPALNSPMLDAIPAANFALWNVSADQRGNPRPIAGFGTIGAVEATYSAAPAITAQPQDMTLTYGETDQSLSVTATSSDGGTLSYQWYVNTTAANAGGSPISGATGNSFTLPATTIATQYYYVVVANDKTGLDIPTSATVSIVAKVTVNPKEITVTANDGQNKVYGASDPAAFIYSVSPALVGTDAFSGALTRISGENAGNYAINQGTLSAGSNYNLTYKGADFVITKRPLTIAAADETIDYGQAPVLNYTITSGSLINGDVLTGKLSVDNLNVGTHKITQGSLTAGNNYDITFVQGTLTVVSVGGDATLTGIDVNGEPAQGSGLDYTANVECDEDMVTVFVSADPNAIVTIDGVAENPHKVSLPKYGDNVVKITVTAPNGDSKTYTLTLNKPIPFNQIVVTRWNNTLTVINNPANNGGYTFTSYKWYRNGHEISADQSISAGDNGEPLDPSDVYSVEVTADGVSGIIRSCESSVTLQNIKFTAYPNPVSKGNMLYVQIDADAVVLKDAVIEIYNESGTLMRQVKVQGTLTPINISYASGNYVFFVKGKDGFKKEVKVVVK